MSAMALNNDSSLPLANARSTPQSRQTSKAKLWTGRVLTTLVGLFLLFDAVGKLVMPPPVVDAFHRLGFPTSLGVGIGILLLVCTVLYLIPRTAVLGAVLVSAFLGGAVAIQMRAGSPTFETIFPVLFAVLAWAGVYLRECRLAALLPLRR
jgi:DoxX-like protein